MIGFLGCRKRILTCPKQICLKDSKYQPRTQVEDIKSMMFKSSMTDGFEKGKKMLPNDPLVQQNIIKTKIIKTLNVSKRKTQNKSIKWRCYYTSIALYLF